MMLEFEDLLGAPPSADGWRLLCQRVERCSIDGLEGGVLEALEDRLASWPPQLRRSPRQWVYRLAKGEHEPRLRLVRCLDLRWVFGPHSEVREALARVLASPWSGLVGLNLMGAALDAESEEALLSNDTLRSLRDLELGFTGVSEAAVEGVCGRFGGLEALGLAGVSLASLWKVALDKLPLLKRLDVSWAGLGAWQGPMVFEGGQGLEALDLSFTGAGYETLWAMGLPALRELGLAGCPVSAAELAKLNVPAPHAALERLDLRFASLDERITQDFHLGSMAVLEQLWLDGNFFGEPFVRALAGVEDDADEGSRRWFGPWLDACPARLRRWFQGQTIHTASRAFDDDGFGSARVDVPREPQDLTGWFRVGQSWAWLDEGGDVAQARGIEDVAAFARFRAWAHELQPRTLDGYSTHHAMSQGEEGEPFEGFGAGIVPRGEAAWERLVDGVLWVDEQEFVDLWAAEGCGPLEMLGQAGLALCGVTLERAHLDALGQTHWGEGVVWGFERCRLSDGAVEAWVASALWDALGVMVLRDVSMSPYGWEVLGAALGRSALKEMHLLGCGMGVEVQQAFLSRGLPYGLRALTWEGAVEPLEVRKDIESSFGARFLVVLDVR